ncbi:hypothetical protein L1D56_07440 [Vibrio diabolicus]|uniref:hypothetical protein n=1 Tax=Vibrio diabolicus TaxID=50719 RepID=UPI00211B21E8|nr:hypothetical protein [Vibrio diabolicus]MCG9619813.1 hypothetical protein [Vibrio diabolicus]
MKVFDLVVDKFGSIFSIVGISGNGYQTIVQFVEVYPDDTKTWQHPGSNPLEMDIVLFEQQYKPLTA